MSNYRSNTTAFIEAQQYSDFVLRTLPTALLPSVFYRNVTDFMKGTTLNIKTVGTATLQEVEENTPTVYAPIETGNVTMAMTDYVGDAYYITDELREDGAQIDLLMAARAQETTRAIATRFESRFYAVANAAQTAAGPNLVNGFAHRFRATGAGWTMDEDDLIAMALAFTKANVPQGGRIAIVDPVVAATFQKKIVLTGNVAQRDPILMSALQNGFANEHQFVMRLHGWEIYTSNLLPDFAAGGNVDGTSTQSASTACKVNLFMSVAGDDVKPIMSAWRRQPRVETERNKDLHRDEYICSARWGLGAQRVDTLGVIVTDATRTE